jgi:uncharacterized membrane protein SpoIIM required for sporulation
MLLNLEAFVTQERPYWESLERQLDRLQNDAMARMTLEEATHFHYLYERVSADLAKLRSCATEPQTRGYLESLVARAYAEIHETRRKGRRIRPLKWLRETLPQTFRRHIRAFSVSTAVTLAGCLLGGFFIAIDPDAREVLLPYPHLMGDPSARVDKEEQGSGRDRMEGGKAQGAAWYITHNTRVSLLTLACGATWGIGSILLLFSNGLLLGAVVTDYVLAGEAGFVTGWLLPHGSVEIPAILIAGQAGLVLAGALVGRGNRKSLRSRLREVSGSVIALTGGIVILLVWAGIIESFLSQYHEPVIPYALKIGFGATQLALVITYFARAGRKA